MAGVWAHRSQPMSIRAAAAARLHGRSLVITLLGGGSPGVDVSPVSHAYGIFIRVCGVSERDVNTGSCSLRTPMQGSPLGSSEGATRYFRQE